MSYAQTADHFGKLRKIFDRTIIVSHRFSGIKNN
jgi:hypothetical protein